MAISLNDNGNYVAIPIIKHQKIGESCKLAVIRFEQRDRLKEDSTTKQKVRIPNGFDRSGKPKYKQELVIHAIAIAGDMVAAIGDESGVPSPGDRVRVILKSKGFGEWIEAKKAHRKGQFHVGDVLELSTTHGQAWNADSSPKGPVLRTMEEVTAVPRGVSLGLYGPIVLREGTDPQWIQKAEEAYRADEAAKRQQQAIQLPAGEAEEEGEDFA